MENLKELDEEARELQRQYLDLLDDEQEQGIYSMAVKDMIGHNEIRLVVNVNDVRRKNPDRYKGLFRSTTDEILACERALRELVATVDPAYSKDTDQLHVGFEGNLGKFHLSPRGLSAAHLGHLVCVEGIVTKLSVVHPKMARSVHFCDATQKTLQRRYTDLTSLDPFPSSSVYPTKDEDGNPLVTQFGLSVFRDHQTFSVQEMPEKAPAGQLPRSVDVICDDDLVDRCKPGDRVQVVGVYRCMPGKKSGFTSGNFRTVLLANNIASLQKTAEPELDAKDVQRVRMVSKEKGAFELLARSMAPSIHGHDYVKKAILCLLLGGNELHLANGSRIRGDINVMLIGDPSVAKSQLLRYVLSTAPRAVTTTGRGSSGVGLTAAVVADHETGERALEAGAMVLADRGVVCIDEFDKMSDVDRTAIHEVMEQGRVSIAKAGIHARLNARCSVLAAANPVYGRYDQFKTPMENIAMQDSLLSRFDLLFVILDKMDPAEDARISQHVLKMHTYRTPGEPEGHPMPMADRSSVLQMGGHQTDDNEQNIDDEEIFAKFEDMVSADSGRPGKGGRSKSQKLLTTAFVRKYIHVARATRPRLTAEAAEHISKEYANIRNADRAHEGVAKTQPITARTLETMVRLATAHAKGRLSRKVQLEDAVAAVELVQFSYFKKVLKREKRRRESEADDVEYSDEEVEEEAADQEPGGGRKRDAAETADGVQSRPRKRLRRTDDPYEFGDSDVSDSEEDRRHMARHKSPLAGRAPLRERQAEVSAERLSQFQVSLDSLFMESGAGSQALELDEARPKLLELGYSEREIDSCLKCMSDENQLMISGSSLFRI